MIAAESGSYESKQTATPFPTFYHFLIPFIICEWYAMIDRSLKSLLYLINKWENVSQNPSCYVLIDTFQYNNVTAIY